MAGREADHSPPSSAEVKKMQISISTPPTDLHGILLNELMRRTTLLYITVTYFIYKPVQDHVWYCITECRI
jgi:hypothetical protein